MNRLPDNHILALIQSDLKEVSRTVSHLDYKVREIGEQLSQDELRISVRALKPLILVLVFQGFISIGILLKIALR